MIVPAQGAFGSNGPYAVRWDDIPSPLWKGHNVRVYSPNGVQGKAPVIFYSHAYGATDPSTTLQMFENLASRGYMVVFSPYPTLGSSDDMRYQTLFAGFDAAAKTFVDRMDLTKVGYVGWSFGGGATPSMAYQGITTKGWGSSHAFMYMMAPWYSYNISPSQLTSFPKHVNLVIQIFDKDPTNDHRMGIDIFSHIGIPQQQKDFLTLYGENLPDCTVVADHTMPSDAKPTPIRAYGIYRLLDALAAYTFDGNQEAYQVALGHGSTVQTTMGTWAPLSETLAPTPTYPENSYQFPWSSNQNPRR
jgi:dienelactone hydrolase